MGAATAYFQNRSSPKNHISAMFKAISVQFKEFCAPMYDIKRNVNTALYTRD